MYRNAAIGVGTNKIGYKLANVKNKYVWENTDDFTINQYTGYEDKTGKRIFEGDIVQFGKKKKDRFIVVWNDYKFVFKKVGSKSLTDKFASWGRLKHVTILGNIYETPELLKKSK